MTARCAVTGRVTPARQVAVPTHGRALADPIAETARTQAGTQAGTYAELAHQLISGDAASAIATAQDINAWNDDLTEFDIDNELIEPGLRAQRALAEAVVAAVAAARQ